MTHNPNEVFLPYPKAPAYKVGDHGTIISPNGNVLSLLKDAAGYLRTRIVAPGNDISCFVHRIVAQTHISNPHNLPEVNHINHLKDDNRAQNLEWVTRAENLSKARAFHGNWSHKAIEKISKPIEAECIKTGQITTYPSARSWAIASGKPNRAANICTALKTGRQSYGFIWRFKDAPKPAGNRPKNEPASQTPIDTPPPQTHPLNCKESNTLPTLASQVQSLRRF